jgi:hypothetical protein
VVDGQPAIRDNRRGEAGQAGDVAHTFDPSLLVGCTLTSAIVGWHHFGSTREAVSLFLVVDDGTTLGVHTTGPGALELRRRDSVPEDYDTAEYGRFVFAPADSRSPVHQLLGCPLLAVRAIRWRGVIAGLQLEAGGTRVVLVNDCDELFVSSGDLPPDYSDATVDP